MTKDELEKATGQELIDARNYCGVDGYYRDYLENVNAEMLKRFNRIAELEKENEKLLESVEGATAMYIDLQEAKKRIAELKAGRPKWHKVADGDLPKNGVLVLSEQGSLVVYKSDCFRWFEYSPNADNIKLRKWEEPVVWCEIPKFEES